VHVFVYLLNYYVGINWGYWSWQDHWFTCSRFYSYIICHYYQTGGYLTGNSWWRSTVLWGIRRSLWCSRS